MHRAAISLVVLLAACLARVAAAPAPPPTSGALQALAGDMTFTWAQLHPLVATQLGIAGDDGKLDTPSEASRAADLALIVEWQGRLDRIAAAGGAKMTLAERDDVTLLRAQLTNMARQYTVYETDRKDYSAPANAIVNAIFTQFQHVPVAGQFGATDADAARAWDDITSRLAKAPAYIVAGQRLVTRPGHLYGFIGAQQLAGAPDFFNGALTAAAKAQLSTQAFARFAKARDATLVVIAQTVAYIQKRVDTWPENYAMGRAAYDAMLRDELLLPFDGTGVERMGSDELEHGWSEQVWLEHLAAERGTPIGPASGGGLAPSGPALVDYYRDRMAELRAFVEQNQVVTVPSWLGEIHVVETPKFLQPIIPGASMTSPRLFAKETDGYYFITPPVSLADAAKRLDANEDFDRDRILSTGAHEAMPGHFLQLSIARRHPDLVRRIQSSGSFVEGWAYYGEEMFVQLGLYGGRLDGRYDVAQWERVRGARAIADVELASGRWTYRQASDYFARETGFTKDAANAEVALIALNPGYLISYTVGRAQIDDLAGEYVRRTGDKGSMLDFHDRLLCYGSTPLSIVGPELLSDLDKPLDEVRASADF